MATVKLSDVIDVEIYGAIAAENNPEKTAWFESGVVVRTSEMDAKAVAEAELTNMPFWRDLDTTSEPNYSDDSDNSATPQKIVQAKMAAKRASLNNGWSARDLTKEMTMGQNPMDRIKDRTSRFWQIQWQKRLIAATVGMYNANLAGNISAGFGTNGDMVVDISIDTGPGTVVNWFDADAFNAARFTLGDHYNDLSAVLVHSTIMQRMLSNDLIDYIKESDGARSVPTFQGHRVIVDDGAPVVATSSGGGFRYTTVLFGSAAFAYGEGSPLTPVEIDRNPAIGSGGGEETLWERKTWLLHPYGHSNLDAANNAGGGLWQNLADLQNAANWERTHYRKNVPIAFLVTNG